MLRPTQLCAAVLTITALLGAASAAAATPGRTPSATATATVPASGPPTKPGPASTPGQPVEPRAAAQIAADVARQQRALTAEQAHLADANAQAVATLQTYQEAQRSADTAAWRARVEAESLVQAVRRTTDARTQFDGYVGSLYRTGMTDTHTLLLSAALSAPDSATFFGGLGLADRVGASQSQVIDALDAAVLAQSAQARQAQAAQVLQRGTAARALVAKAAADTIVAASAARVAARTATLITTHGALAVAQAREVSLATAEAIAALRAGIPAAAIAGAPALRTAGACVGGDTRGYPNGMLPVDALCPLWGTAGQVLRADAAAAFDALSHEYAAQFASPICVTDSYRSYDAQVAVKILKPALAAAPGSSNHGWGVAVDLCDGIERFGTPAHAWMLANAMRFGWFHPAWAEPTGSKPEPWHWEYAGATAAPPPPPAPVDLGRLTRQLHR